MNEVTAVVLSVGERYTARAIESLAAQTLPLREIITVEHVSPFFRAINEGARRVSTPFFVQVDADMILDPRCVEVLLGEMRADAGIVVGELRDALFGQVVGIKMFRTECFRRAAMPDSISPDTDFGARLRRQGWQTAYIGEAGDNRPALGEHRPDYSPSYTYRKLLLEGGRLRHRGVRHGLFWIVDRLEQSTHPMAVLAQIALAHGFFLRSERDELKPPADDARAEWLHVFLRAEGRLDAGAASLPAPGANTRLREVFRRYVAAGKSLKEAGAGATFGEVFAGLSGTGRDAHPLVAKVALGHGLLMDQRDRAGLMDDERAFRDFMLFGIGRRASAWDHLRARVRHLAGSQRFSSARW
jgi:hypothetical protein